MLGGVGPLPRVVLCVTLGSYPDSMRSRCRSMILRVSACRGGVVSLYSAAVGRALCWRNGKRTAHDSGMGFIGRCAKTRTRGGSHCPRLFSRLQPIIHVVKRGQNSNKNLIPTSHVPAPYHCRTGNQVSSLLAPFRILGLQEQ